MSFECGADCVVCGSVAVKEPLKLVKWLREFGGEKVILGADLRDGKAAVAGWTEDSSVTADSLVERFMKNGLSQAIVTDISKDGMLQGPSDQLYVQLQEKFPTVIFTVSGGISSMDDIRRLDALGLRRVIVGKAIYENRISMEDIALWSQKG
jgi:phosphoribosylformimino-5-aminoimidazole carboxamide ribotide isomerase